MSTMTVKDSPRNPILGTPVAGDRDPRETRSQTGLVRMFRDAALAAHRVDDESGLRGLAEKFRAKLERGTSAADIEFNLDHSLLDLTRSLRAEGVSAEDIDTAVSTFKSQLAAEVNALADAAGSSAAETTKSAVAAREVVKNRLSLDILTTEGDRVSIRFRSKEVTSAAVAQVSGEAGTATAASVNVLSRGRIAIEVDGELNADELAAINDLLDDVDAVAGEFFGGDVEAAFAAAARVGIESDALSAFDLRMSYSRSISLAQRYSDVQRLPAVTTAKSAPAPREPTGPAPAAVETAPTPDITPTEVVIAPTDVPTVPAPAPAPTSARDTIASFTKSVLARLSAADAEHARFSLSWKVDFLVSALSAAAPSSDETAPAATEALGQSLASQVPTNA